MVQPQQMDEIHEGNKRGEHCQWKVLLICRKDKENKSKVVKDIYM